MSTAQQPILKKGDALQSGDPSRQWGVISCMGTAYNEIIVNFNPSGGGQYQTVIVPTNLQQFALAALEYKMTVLATFSGPLAPYVTITDLIIYN